MADLSRRSFIQGLGVGAVASVGTIVGVPANAAALPKWDKTTDVVVVGMGGAGMATAIAAADDGAKVMILERQPEATHRSNTRMSGGFFHGPDKNGDPKALFEYSLAMLSGDNIPWKGEGEQPEVAEGMARVWAKYAPTTVEWMKSLDPEFKVTTSPKYKGAAFKNFPGAADCAYQVWNATYLSKASGNVSSYNLPKNETHHGEAFHHCLLTGVKNRAAKIERVYEFRAQHLVKNDKGEVIGVIGDYKGKTMAIKARKAVVLCSGGYEYNAPMRRAFLEGPGIEGWAFYGTTYNEGDGIRMAQEAGAGLMKAGKAASRIIWPAPVRHNGMRIGMITPVVGMGHSIVVDNYGKRYTAENKVTDDPSRYFFYKEAVKFNINTLQYAQTPSWLIFDETLRLKRPLINYYDSTPGYDFIDYGKPDNSDAIAKGWILKADTIEELGKLIKAQGENRDRMDPAVLAKTVATYNQYCADGEDKEFNRKKRTLQPVKDGPFYAIPLVAGGPNTKGGLAANEKREVLDWNLKPIPGLYCVGEIASALKFVYQAGGNLTECLIYGQACGKEVAKLPNRA